MSSNTATKEKNWINSNPDGSFNRPASSFRDFIQKGGKFESEKGGMLPVVADYH